MIRNLIHGLDSAIQMADVVSWIFVTLYRFGLELLITNSKWIIGICLHYGLFSKDFVPKWWSHRKMFHAQPSCFVLWEKQSCFMVSHWITNICCHQIWFVDRIPLVNTLVPSDVIWRRRTLSTSVFIHCLKQMWKKGCQKCLFGFLGKYRKTRK